MELQGGRDLPAQGTIKISPEAYKILAHRAIDAEMRPNELLDAIILHSDWEKDLPALLSRSTVSRNDVETKTEGDTEESVEKGVENSKKSSADEKTRKPRAEESKALGMKDSLDSYTGKGVSSDADPS
jgi:hypothetical protein